MGPRTGSAGDQGHRTAKSPGRNRGRSDMETVGGTRQLWNSRQILKSLIRRGKDGLLILPEGAPESPIEDIRGSVATSIETSGTHLLGKDVTRLVRDYERGATVSELVKKYGIHRATVRTHLTRAGIAPRDRVPDDPNGDDYLRLYNQGIGLTTIARRNGTTPSKVRTQLIKRGVDLRG